MSAKLDTERFTYKGHTFRLTTYHDDHSGVPWEDCAGHGVVTDWFPREDRGTGESTQREGYRVLVADTHGWRRYYDVHASLTQARVEGWDAPPYKTGTPEEQAVRAVEADYEYLRAWCNGEWGYIGVDVQWITPTGEETTHSASVWGVEDRDPAYVWTVAEEISDQLLEELPTWAGKQYARAAEMIWTTGEGR